MFDYDGRNGAATLAITSGKGGVGKTSLATNLAIALQRRGNRVCLLDADMGLANVNILLGLQPSHSLDDLRAGRVGPAELIMRGPEGMDILPAAAGLERLATRSPHSDPILSSTVAQLEAAYDYLLVDTPAGIGETTRAFVEPCDMTALVITPEPTSLTDGFTLLRTMLREGYEGTPAVIVNMLPADQPGERLFERFQAAAQRYLDIDLCYLGAVPMDRGVTRAVVNQQPLLVSAPQSPAAMALERLAARVTAVLPARSGCGRFGAAWTPQETAPVPPEGETAPPTGNTDGHRPPADEDGPVADIPTVVTAPEGFETAPQWTLEELAGIAESLLGAPDIDESTARRFFGRLEQSFSERFRRRASDIKALIYETLVQDHLGEEQLREIRDVLVETYARRFSNEAGADAPAAPHPHVEGDRRGDLESRLAALYGKTDWDEARSRRLLEWVRALHTERFGPENDDRADITRREVEALRERFESQRRALEARMTEACLLMEEHARVLAGERRHPDAPPDEDGGPP